MAAVLNRPRRSGLRKSLCFQPIPQKECKPALLPTNSPQRLTNQGSSQLSTVSPACGSLQILPQEAVLLNPSASAPATALTHSFVRKLGSSLCFSKGILFTVRERNRPLPIMRATRQGTKFCFSADRLESSTQGWRPPPAAFV